jgi:hypothetical protein
LTTSRGWSRPTLVIRFQEGSIDKLSGAQVERPGLNEALAQLRQADTLVVWKLDRLGRSVKGLVDLVFTDVKSCAGRWTKSTVKQMEMRAINWSGLPETATTGAAQQLFLIDTELG